MVYLSLASKLLLLWAGSWTTDLLRSLPNSAILWSCDFLKSKMTRLRFAVPRAIRPVQTISTLGSCWEGSGYGGDTQGSGCSEGHFLLCLSALHHCSHITTACQIHQDVEPDQQAHRPQQWAQCWRQWHGMLGQVVNLGKAAPQLLRSASCGSSTALFLSVNAYVLCHCARFPSHYYI